MAVGPTIVVAAHARPQSTRRLLETLLRSDLDSGTPLIISIDRGTDPAVASESDQIERLAGEFSWPFGHKQIIIHDGIGLVAHFHACGELTRDHDAIVLLEDDLVVGPGFMRWATAALQHAETDARIAGVSLAAPWFDGYRRLRFEPIDDGTDAFFAQVPWYDGMAWTRRMWHDYVTTPPATQVALHAAFDELPDDEWFPGLMRYLVASNRYWLLPRSAHATNTGAAGAHFADRTDWFQVPLALAAPATLRFANLDDSAAIYDDHMEPTAASVRRACPELEGLIPDALVVDLGGTRDLTGHADEQLVLTTRPADSPIRTWGAAMHPLVMNVAYDEPGDAISLARRRDIATGPAADAASLATLKLHHDRGQPTPRSEALTTLLPQMAPQLLSLRDRIRRER